MRKTLSDKKVVLSLTEVGAMYDLQPPTVLRLARERHFKAFQLGRSWRVDKASLDAYIASTIATPRENEEEVVNA
jgi:excisionase family DNA binding protein